jgi:glycosyltransferase involved in cell wall biosynthesis
VAAFAIAAKRIEGLRGEFYGEGPEREAMLGAIVEHDVEEIVLAPGFVQPERIDEALRRALCMLSTSRREGYGMVVVEAAARATPSVVVAGEDNAATELIADGVNGLVVKETTAEAIAQAIVEIHAAGMQLRQSTASWFADNAKRLSIEASLTTVLDSYATGMGRPPVARA